MTKRIEEIIKNLNSINVNEFYTNFEQLTFKAKSGKLSLEAARKISSLTSPLLLKSFENPMSYSIENEDEACNNNKPDLNYLPDLKNLLRFI
ncbi:MAG: hypothetical protein HWD61_12215 [Parachlamydiaceae bacterium]|nr:MAG: hypothetical protein HWD61_12215 [Parachlamydiaceae bacterium]